MTEGDLSDRNDRVRKRIDYFRRLNEQLRVAVSAEREKEECFETPDGSKPVEVEGFIIGKVSLNNGLVVYPQEAHHIGKGEITMTIRRGEIIPPEKIMEFRPVIGDIVVVKRVQGVGRIDIQVLKPQ